MEVDAWHNQARSNRSVCEVTRVNVQVNIRMNVRVYGFRLFLLREKGTFKVTF